MEFHVLLRELNEVTHSVSCSIIHKNNCTYGASLRYIYLPGSNNLSHVENSFASASIKREEGGVTLHKAGFLQYVVVCIVFPS